MRAIGKLRKKEEYGKEILKSMKERKNSELGVSVYLLGRERERAVNCN